MARTLLVKLGGSLITDKRRARTARIEVIRRLAGEIRQLLEEESVALILGHGSGSFGHVAAKEHDVHLGIRSPDQLPGVAATQHEAATLHRLVVGALLEAGVPTFSLAPSSFLVAVGGRPVEVGVEPLRRALDLGLTPVVYGDVVVDREMGCSICSTETLFLVLASALVERGRPVDGILWLGETDGIYDATGEIIPEIRGAEPDAHLGHIEGASGTDVTGGMHHRLETALELAERGIPSLVLNGLEPDRLVAAAHGEAVPGTRIRP